MSEQTLLIIFIGLVALSLVGIALVATAVGWQVYKLFAEARLMLKKLHEAEDAALADIKAMRETVRSQGAKVWGIIDFLLSMASRRKTRSRTSADNETKSE